MIAARRKYHVGARAETDATARGEVSAQPDVSPSSSLGGYGRHARERTAPRTTLIPIPPHVAEYGLNVHVNGRYVTLTFPDGRRPVYLTVHAADSLASAILKAGREATAAEVA